MTQVMKRTVVWLSYPVLDMTPPYHPSPNKLSTIISHFLINTCRSFNDCKIEEFVISEMDSIISILLKISLEWRDPLIRFNYLKDYVLKNTLRNNEWNDIWKPKLGFSIVEKNPKELKRQICVKKIEKPSPLRDDFSISPKEAYIGEENELNMILEYQAVFICPYNDITKYPFDAS